MPKYVVDENVPIVANDARRVLDGKDPHADHVDPTCSLACIAALRTARTSVVVLDSASEVLSRYRGKLAPGGQPGVGDEFLRHLLDKQYDEKYVLLVDLEKTDEGEFTDFPSAKQLDGFDTSDRVFVALTVASSPDSILLNAVDSDYSHYSEALTECGVVVHELCPEVLKPTPASARRRDRTAAG